MQGSRPPSFRFILSSFRRYSPLAANNCLFDANFVSTSPLTIYLSAASYCDLLGINKTGLHKRIKSYRPVTRVLGALIPLLSFVLSMIITFSDRAFVDSQACKGSTFVTWVSELSLLCLDCFTEPKSLYPHQKT